MTDKRDRRMAFMLDSVFKWNEMVLVCFDEGKGGNRHTVQQTITQDTILFSSIFRANLSL